MKKITHKSINKKLFDVWAKIVKIKSRNRCEYCGSREHLNSHHIFGKTIRATAWDIENGICLCFLHHTWGTDFSAHLTPTLFTEWIIKKRGKQWHDRLRKKILPDIHRTPLTVGEKQKLYKELQEELKQNQE